MGRFIDITGAPIASDFQEMPLDFMSKALDIQQKSKDTFDTARESMLPSEAGLLSTNIKMPDGKIISLAQYDKDTYDKPLEDIAKIAINNPAEANRRFGIFKKQRENDPMLKWAKEDAALKANQIAQDKAFDAKGKAYRSYKDTSGKYIPVEYAKVVSGEIGSPIEQYKGRGFADYITPIRTRLKEAKEEKHISTNDIDPIITQYGGLGNAISALKQGKITNAVDRMTWALINDDIETAAIDLLKSGSDYSEYYKLKEGITDYDGNMIVDEATALEIAKKFVTKEAENFVYNNSTTSTDTQITPLSDGSGKKKKDPEDDEETTVEGAGTIVKSNAVNQVLKAVQGKTTADLNKEVTNLAYGIFTNKDLAKTNPGLAAVGNLIYNSKTGQIDLSLLTPDIMNKMIVEANKVKDPNISNGITALQGAKMGYDLLQAADTESDIFARRRSGYTEADEKQYSPIPEFIRNGLKNYSEDKIRILDDGSVQVTGATVERGTPEKTTLGKINPKDKPILLKYIKEVNKKDSKIKAYDRIKQEEYNNRTNPNYEYQQGWNQFNWGASTQGAKDQEQLNKAVWASVTNLIQGTGDEESILMEDNGKAVDLKNFYPDEKSMQIVAYTDEPDGTKSVKFKLTKQAALDNGKTKSQGEGVYILKGATPAITKVINKYTDPVKELANKATSIVADWERNPIPETKTDGTPYLKTVSHDSKPIKMQNVGNVTNYTFPLDTKDKDNNPTSSFVEFYNKYADIRNKITDDEDNIIEKISVNNNYGTGEMGTIIHTYDILKASKKYFDAFEEKLNKKTK
jgi:hypothetical protein